jgi:hypothetical protein
MQFCTSIQRILIVRRWPRVGDNGLWFFNRILFEGFGTTRTPIIQLQFRNVPTSLSLHRLY